MKTALIALGSVIYIAYLIWLFIEIKNAPYYDEKTKKFISKNDGKGIDELN